MRLEYVQPHPNEFAKILDIHKLFPDLWKKEPLQLVEAMKRSVFWLIKGRQDETVGVVWLGGVVEGDSASLHIVLDGKYRRYLRPRKVDPIRIQRARAQAFGKDKGAMRQEIFSYCFEQLNLRRLTLMVPYQRKAALRFAKTMGFTNEGMMRDAASISGRVCDIVIWGYTQKEYRQEFAQRATA